MSDRSDDRSDAVSSADATPGKQSLPASLVADLRVGLGTHRPYAGLAAALLLVAIPAGWLLGRQGRPVASLPLPMTGNALYPQELPLLTILESDTELLALLLVGALTAGALTVVGLLTQGLLVGSFLGASAGTLGPAYLAISVLPHALPRAVAFVLAAAIGFRLVACAFGWLFGVREQFQRPAEWRQAGLVLALAWLWLVVSALIEAFVTFRLLDALF